MIPMAERGPEARPGKSEAEIEAEKAVLVDSFIDSTGMPRWFARIVFREQIQVIYDNDL